MISIKINSKAPDFSLPDQTGNMHSLAEYKGRWVLLYFYPKDDTTGCTKEACAFRDAWAEFGKLNAVVLGISIDTVKSHDKFAKKYKLPFTILSDEKKEAVEAYGVWDEKSMYGRTYMGTLRTSFLIDPQGKIVKIYEKVKPEIHAEEVLMDLERQSA